MAYVAAYEDFRYTHPSASAVDLESIDDILAGFIDEEYAQYPSNASPQKLKNLMAMLSIAAPATKNKHPKAARLIHSWTKNCFPNPYAPWTPQIAAAVAMQLLETHKAHAATAVILQFAAMLRPSELFAITWEDVLFPGDLHLTP